MRIELRIGQLFLDRAYSGLLLLQLIVRDLEVVFRVPEIPIDAFDILLVLRGYLVLSGSLIQRLSRVDFTLRPIYKALTEVRVLLQVIPSRDRNMPSDDAIDVLHGRDDSFER